MFIATTVIQSLIAPFRSERWMVMVNTFSQIYIQTVFAVSNRESLINSTFKEELFKYISGIVTNQGQKLIAINGMEDHVHLLIGLRPAMGAGRFGERNQIGFVGLHKPKEVGAWPIQLAGRLWSIFIWPFSTGYDNQIHSESREAPPSKVV